jgi:polyisoprenoid-binding protein YceI
MKSILLLLSTALLWVAPSAEKLNFLSSESEVTWTGYATKAGFSLSGTLKLRSVSVKINDNQIEEASIFINMRSIKSEHKILIRELRGKDFFDTDSYPVAHFELTETISLNGDAPQTAKGILTIKDISEPVEFPVSIHNERGLLNLKGKAKISRKLFDIYQNAQTAHPLMGTKAISDVMELDFSLFFDE